MGYDTSTPFRQPWMLPLPFLVVKNHPSLFLFRITFPTLAAEAFGINGTDSAPPGLTDKAEEAFGFGAPLLGGSLFEGLGDIPAFQIEEAEGPLDLQPGRRAKSRAAESDRIDASDQIGPIGHEEGGDIFTEALASPHHAEPSNPDELMEDRASSEHGTILNGDIAREQAVVGDDDPVADRGVVSEVDADHEKVVVANGGGTPLLCPAMDGDVFAQNIVIPDHHFAVGSRLEVEILRIATDDGTVTDGVAGTEKHMTPDHSPGLDLASLADDRPRLDDRARSDLNPLSELRCGINKCGGMNRRHDS